MKILSISRDLPATSRMPGSPRFFNFCQGLAAVGHELSLLCFLRSQDRWHWFESQAPADRAFRQFEFLPQPPQPSWWCRQQHRFLLSSHLSTQHLLPDYFLKVSQAIRDYTQRVSPDLVLVDGIEMTQYLLEKHSIPHVVDLTDCLTLLFWRTAGIEKQIRQKLAWYAEAWRLSRWERSLPKYFPLLLTISDVDRDYVQQLNSAAHVLTIPNGIDSEYFAPSTMPGSSEILIFSGVMGYGPNEDAAIFFANEILPLVRKQFPNVALFIVGQEPGSKVQALASIPGVHVTGTVEDVRPYFYRAGIYVCPLRYGAGMKNKLLSAMAMGIPVVATSLSLEGIDVMPGKDVLVADAPDAFAHEVIRLLSDPLLYQQLRERSLAIVREKYSWKKVVSQLESALTSVGQSSVRE